MPSGESSESLQLNYELTPVELRSARKVLWRSNVRGSSIKNVLFAGFIIIAISVLTYFRIDGEPLKRLIFAFGAAALFVLFYALVSFDSRRKKPIEMSVQINQSGVRILGSDGVTELTWRGILRLIETDDAFYVVRNEPLACYVLPKRACPDLRAMDWFRSNYEAGNADGGSEQTTPRDDTGEIRIETRYGIGDAIARSRASWGIRLITFAVLVAVFAAVGIGLWRSERPLSLRDELIPLLPFIIVFPVLVVIAPTLMNWWFSGSARKRWTMSLDFTGLTASAGGGGDKVRWERFSHFKEISTHFILWRSGERLWIMIPKRTLDEPQQRWLRGILSARLTRSTWFWGYG